MDLTQALCPTRPINECSGYVHVETDIFTVHDYDQNPEAFGQRYASVVADGDDVVVRFPEISSPTRANHTWWKNRAALSGSKNTPARDLPETTEADGDTAGAPNRSRN